jgi:hypothetical protein
VRSLGSGSAGAGIEFKRVSVCGIGFNSGSVAGFSALSWNVFCGGAFNAGAASLPAADGAAGMTTVPGAAGVTTVAGAALHVLQPGAPHAVEPQPPLQGLLVAHELYVAHGLQLPHELYVAHGLQLPHEL